jgi:tetratricopeptide (TPR) repeat protein
MLIGKEQEAHASLRKLIDILDRLEREFGGQDQYRGPLAHLSVSAGWLLHGTGQDLDGREKLARRAQAHVQAVAAQLPDDATLRSTLANSHQQLGIVLGCTARAKESEAELRQAASLFETLAEESPETADNRASLAHVRNALGWGLRAENMVAAEQEYRRALALFEALSNELPDNPWYQAHRAMLLETVATLQRDRGDLTGARTLLEQAIVYAQKACDLDSRSQYFRDRLQSTRAELERTLKAHEPEKNEIPK